MKTRTELLLDFMLALSENPSMVDRQKDDKTISRDIFLTASELADKYIKVVSGTL